MKWRWGSDLLLSDVKLVISDAHEGIKAAVSKLLHANWQRCRVHCIRNILAHAGRQGHRVVSAFIAAGFAQELKTMPKRRERNGAALPISCCPSSPASWTTPKSMCSPI
jgi:transposase-like protein